MQGEYLLVFFLFPSCLYDVSKNLLVYDKSRTHDASVHAEECDLPPGGDLLSGDPPQRPIVVTHFM